MTDEIRQTIRFNSYASGIIKDKAAPLWPELDGNLTGLIHKIIADWDHMRDGGGRTHRLEQRMDRHERLMQLVCDRLGIDTEAIDQ